MKFKSKFKFKCNYLRRSQLFEFKPVHAIGLFLYPPENIKGFLLCSGGVERDQWHKMSLSENRLTLS